jgi:hypothetical protein
MVMARRPRTEGYSIPLAYLIWATGGILGLHRLYLKNLWGLLFLPLFLAVLWANAEGRDARNVQSDAANAVRVAERVADRSRGRLDGSDERIAEAEAALAAAEEGSFAARRAERALEREREGARRPVSASPPPRPTSPPRAPLWSRRAPRAHSGTTPRSGCSTCICAALLIDAALIPMLVRRADRAHSGGSAPGGRGSRPSTASKKSRRKS